MNTLKNIEKMRLKMYWLVGKKCETRNSNVVEIFMQSHWNLHDFKQQLKMKILGHVTSSIFSDK